MQKGAGNISWATEQLVSKLIKRKVGKTKAPASKA
jgi:hypothetical protein